MTNKYLEKVAEVVTRGYTYEGLPESTFYLNDAHAARLAERIDDLAGRDRRLGHLTGVTLGGGGAGGILGAILAGKKARLGGGVVGTLAGLIAGNIAGRYNPIAKNLYREAYELSAERPLEDRAQDWTSKVLSGMPSAYPSRGDYGKEEVVALQLDPKGSTVYVRPSVIARLRDEAVAEAQNDSIFNAGVAARYGTNALTDRGSSWDAASAGLHGASALMSANDVGHLRRAPDEQFKRDLVDALRQEMLYR